MEFFEAVRQRRSIRKFKPDSFPDHAIEKALEAAVLAPNSSNVQTWDFHWIRNTDLKAKVVQACFSQSAARTASQILVITADPNLWQRSQEPLIRWVEAANAPKVVHLYYRRIIPMTYRAGWFNLLAIWKVIAAFFAGFFRVVPRGPYTKRDLEEVAIKSAALAAENFVLAISAQGGATCMMEGFDEVRMKKALRLKSTTRVVMAIGVGYESERGTWGPRFRLPMNDVVHRYD